MNEPNIGGSWFNGAGSGVFVRGGGTYNVKPSSEAGSRLSKN